MPEMTDPTFYQTLADVIACPAPACGATARIVDRWTFESTGSPVEHVKPAASAATGSLPWSSRSPPHPPMAEPGPGVGLPELRTRSAAHPFGQDRNVRVSRGGTMALQIGDTAPDFEAETTQGRIRFHDWIGDGWAVLFSHPKDFTPVCTTELGYMAKVKPEFDRRNVRIIGLSVDPVGHHARWASDIEQTQGQAPNYPIIGDADFNVSKLYGMLPATTSGDPLERTPADNQTVRNVFVVGSDKKVKLVLVYPMTTGRNFDEVLRVIDSLQLTVKHKVATPVNWQQGEDVIIAGSVSDDEARKTYPEGWRSPRPYLRIVPQPR
jgi:thioredoxin-dependent peroxiredoxin